MLQIRYNRSKYPLWIVRLKQKSWNLAKFSEEFAKNKKNWQKYSKINTKLIVVYYKQAWKLTPFCTYAHTQTKHVSNIHTKHILVCESLSQISSTAMHSYKDKSLLFVRHTHTHSLLWDTHTPSSLRHTHTPSSLKHTHTHALNN